MAAARYWRIVGIEAYSGGDLELSEIALYSGASRIDGAATLTSGHAPVAGALVDLKDGSTSTACRFAAADVRSAGFYLQWDFGAATEVTEIKIGAASSAARFLAAGTLVQGASVGVWSYVATFSGVVYPGAGALTSSSGGVVPTAWNPLDKASGATLSNGNLTLVGGQSDGSARSVFGTSSGKWYWEYKSSGSRFPIVGVARSSATLGSYPGATADGWSYYGGDGAALKGNAGFTAYGQLWTSPSDVIGVALDMDSGTLTFFKNGVSMGVAFSGLTGTLYAMAGGDTDSATSKTTANFGASPFAYEPPSGHTHGFGASGMKLPVTAAPRLRTAGGGIAVAAASDIPAFGTSTAGRPKLARDVEFGGPGTIYGTTKTKGTPNVPTKARVVLQHQRSKLPVRETWSDPVTGAFEFSGLDANQQFLALVEDAAGNFRPVAASKLVPEVLA